MTSTLKQLFLVKLRAKCIFGQRKRPIREQLKNSDEPKNKTMKSNPVPYDDSYDYKHRPGMLFLAFKVKLECS